MLNIPFYKNLKDDCHCFQACLKMLLKYTFPDESYSYEKLNKLTSHGRNQWTWNTAGLIFLAKKGFEIVSIENFDHKQFAEFGNEYLRMIWSNEIFEEQKKHSNFKKEREWSRLFVKNKTIKHLRRPTTFSEIEKFFQKGYIVLVTITPFRSGKKMEYGRHIVVITDINKKTVTFHDPGLPPYENRVISRKDFQEALYFPYKEIASLIAVRHSNFEKR